MKIKTIYLSIDGSCNSIESTTKNLFNNLNGKKLTEKDKDAFKIMELGFDSEWPAIQKKFKILVKKFHPDKNAGNIQFENKLKKITLAYSHLKFMMVKK